METKKFLKSIRKIDFNMSGFGSISEEDWQKIVAKYNKELNERPSMYKVNPGRYADYLLSLPSSEWSKTLPNGETYMHWACEMRCPVSVQLLIDADVPVDAKNLKRFVQTPIDKSIIADDPPTLALLLKHGAARTYREGGYLSIFKCAISLGAAKCVNFLAPMVTLVQDATPFGGFQIGSTNPQFLIGYSKTPITVPYRNIDTVLSPYITHGK